MGFLRFRRSIKLFPGVKINLSKTGVSTSIGRRGLWYTIGPRGTRTTLGIPGSGLSYTATESWKAGSSAPPAPDVSQPATLAPGPAAPDSALPLAPNSAAPGVPESTAPVGERWPNVSGGRVFLVLAIIALVIVALYAVFALR